jgi:phosphatidylserine/phosphatidylglycerophosphate/cardiolipin synthase-like enzyme
MNWKGKFLVALLVLSVVFGTGVWVGFQMDRGDVDPQDHIETVFTPYEDGTARYLEFLDRARESVYMAGYSFTDERIADKLIELRTRRGIKEIHVLLDLEQTQGWSGSTILSLVEKMRAAGIEVVIGTSEKSSEIMHHKYTVVDGIWVEDGSFNYTKAANRQANALNFVKSKKRAALFLANWQRMHRFMQAQEAQRRLDQSQPAPKPPASKPPRKNQR